MIDNKSFFLTWSCQIKIWAENFALYGKQVQKGYFSEPESEEWQPEPEDFETTTEGPIDYPEPTPEVEVKEVFQTIFYYELPFFSHTSTQNMTPIAFGSPMKRSNGHQARKISKWFKKTSKFHSVMNKN